MLNNGNAIRIPITIKMMGLMALVRADFFPFDSVPASFIASS
jgi:hypothetical protein